MTVKLSITTDGKVKITTGSERVRLDDLNKWLARNRDAILVKLDGPSDPSMVYKPGHVCRFEEENGKYNTFVGHHPIGQLPDEAISFAEQIDMSPEFMVSIVGKVENGDIYIYIAE